MAPDLSFPDSLHMSMRNAKTAPNLPRGFLSLKRPNGSDHSRGQFRIMHLFSTRNALRKFPAPMVLSSWFAFWFGVGTIPIAARALFGMRMGTISLPKSLPFLAVPIPHIVGMRPQKQMLRAHTGPYITMMTDQKPFWDRPIDQGPGDAMRPDVVLVPHTHSITISCCPTGPQPTGVRLRDVRPKVSFEGAAGKTVCTPLCSTGTGTKFSASFLFSAYRGAVHKKTSLAIETHSLLWHRPDLLSSLKDAMSIPYYFTLS